MNVEAISVSLGKCSYDVYIGYGLLDQAAGYVKPLLKRPKLAIVTDETVKMQYCEALAAVFSQKGITTSVLSIPPGETSKSWEQLSRVSEWLLDEKVERQDMVIALGGGVVGDLVGFAAAILRRGVRFVQIPTTLLAQVDSSVGGKTGINTLHGKNLIGAFYQPSLVLADISVLETLRARDFLAGYGEVVKYGLLGDSAFFTWLEKNGPNLHNDPHKRQYAVHHSVKMKANIVERDETEMGERALLNLGHTFCHALEKATGYSDRLLHGEGVAIGCVLAFDLSARLGLCSGEISKRIKTHLRRVGMKADITDIAGDIPKAETLLSLMAQDKKVVDGKLRFVLARDIGRSFVADNVPADAVIETLQATLGFDD